MIVSDLWAYSVQSTWVLQDRGWWEATQQSIVSKPYLVFSVRLLIRGQNPEERLTDGPVSETKQVSKIRKNTRGYVGIWENSNRLPDSSCPLGLKSQIVGIKFSKKMKISWKLKKNLQNFLDHLLVCNCYQHLEDNRGTDHAEEHH